MAPLCFWIVPLPLLELLTRCKVENGCKDESLPFGSLTATAWIRGICTFTSDEFLSFAPVMCVAISTSRRRIGFRGRTVRTAASAFLSLSAFACRVMRVNIELRIFLHYGAENVTLHQIHSVAMSKSSSARTSISPEKPG